MFHIIVQPQAGLQGILFDSKIPEFYPGVSNGKRQRKKWGMIYVIPITYVQIRSIVFVAAEEMDLKGKDPSL